MYNSTLEYDKRLDAAFLESIYENDKEHAAMVFEQFLKLYPNQFKELEDSFVKGNVTTFRQKIHKLKPTFSFVGLTELTAKAEVIEKKCLDIDEISIINDLYFDFKNNLFELIPIVETELERFKA